ncbi:MAG: FAD-binding oxidoreductase [Deltaproteobacteria bacterium]|nr:MAG: FAD-binding oxidoreductase [Deltaproteobacteria bacterium]
MKEIVEKLVKIVGAEFVSDQPEERYIYSMDPGTMPPREPDIVVIPGTSEEVRQIMILANRDEIPVVPLGAGLVLSGLSRALKGGIILDMKRMNRILEVNETSRYAVVEAGTSQGMLQAYLKKHHPNLKHSAPDAPPVATIAGNVSIHGSGHLSHAAGFHSDMLNGLEVVLPTGEVARIGSCATSPYWFSRAPLPDLAGLFLGWAGTTGVITKLAIKLYPNYKYNDVGIFVTEEAQLIPDILHRMTGTQVAEDMTTWMTPKPDWARGFLHCDINFGANTKDELIWKRNLIRASVQEYIDQKVAGFMPLPPAMKQPFLEVPARTLSRFADVRRGGGFEYVGAIMPVDLFPEAYKVGLEIADSLNVNYSLGSRIIGVNHCMMFFYAYAFNRADPADVERAQKALEETNRIVVDMGGIPWKAEAPAQKEIIRKMDPNMFDLMNRIRAVLDPKGIMNPGNWEED